MEDNKRVGLMLMLAGIVIVQIATMSMSTGAAIIGGITFVIGAEIFINR